MREKGQHKHKTGLVIIAIGKLIQVLLVLAAGAAALILANRVPPESLAAWADATAPQSDLVQGLVDKVVGTDNKTLAIFGKGQLCVRCAVRGRGRGVGTTRFGFIEGPVWIAELGVLLFSDMNFSGGDAKGPPSRIRRLKPPSSFDVLVETANSNGLALSLEGAVLAATHDTQSLSAFDAQTGKRTDLTVRYQGKRFNSPNDLTIRDDGTVYFSDPDYQLGSRSSELGSVGVYRVSAPLGAAEGAAELVDGTLQKPNGLALSPDQRTLYVGSSGNEVWKFSVASDGSVSNRTKFAEVGGSDGMAVDCAGNLYVTSGAVEVFAPSGDKLGEISTAESPSNAAFGGADKKTLYITAQTGLYSIALAVPGFPY
ncbi:MAG: hypothetical protein RLZZ450_520 [Pseudomonadota bacterium]|jgi:gluconolactonase